MAKPEATEKATPKRRREARNRGQVPRSQDIGGAAILLAIVIALHVSFMSSINAAGEAFEVALTHAGSTQELNLHSASLLFVRGGLPYVTLLATVFVAAFAIAITANLLQFGLLFAPQLVAPKFSKLNPLSGFKRLFLSKQTLINLLKQVFKLSIVALLV